VDHQVLCDGQQSHAPSPPETSELTHNARAVVGRAVTTPTSLGPQRTPLPEVAAYRNRRPGHGSGR